MRYIIIGFSALGILSACGEATVSQASGLLSAQGTFLDPLEDAKGDTVTLPGTADGYAFQVGLNESRSAFVTQALLLDGTDLPAPTAEGNAQMTGTYQLETFQFPVTNADGNLTGTRLSRERDITLLVDFDTFKLSGEDAGLTLNGTFGPQGQVRGTATLGDMSGDMAGEVGNDNAIGVFDGQSATGVFAGGFIVNK